MFEVGIKRANEEYNKILEEVKALAKMADNSISLKVQLEKSNDLKTFLDALKQLGDGKMLEPLLHKIDNLQASMVRLGMIPKDIDYSNLEKQLQKVTVAYENYQKAREKAGLKEGQADVTGPTMALGQVYRTARANLEKEFGLSENVARATMDTFKNMGNTIQENMARIGGSKAGMESLSGEVGGLTTKVDALVNAFSSLVSQLKSLGTGSGVKDMATDVAKVDEGTSKMAQALAKAFGNLNEKKADVKVSEDSLATATNTAVAALKAEEAQAQATAASILRVADSISVATLATKNLYTILGGNREDVAKFLELANTMDMLSRKSAYIMNSGESFSGGKMGAFTEVKKEMEAVQAQMDELKKSGLSGSPIIDSFATAFKNLSEVLTAAGTSVKESTKNLKSLGEGAKNLEKISEGQERASRAKNQTTESIQKETQARKKGAAAANETSSAEDKAASSAKANAEAIQKLLTATQELTTATNNLNMAIGSWGQDKGTIATMVAQFEELRKKITQVVEQWEKLAMVKATGVQNVQVPSFNIDLSSIEPTIKTLNEAVAQLKKSMDLLWESTNRMESSLKAIVTPETFKKVESDAASAKQKVDELSKSVEGMKMQSEKKGSETTLNANLDVLKNHTKNVYEALTQIAVEYEKLSNQKLRDDGLEQRLLKLREYYEWLQKVATMTDTLSKPGALKADATKFNGELLMGKQTKEMWSDKAVKDFQKRVEEILSGRRAAESFETAIRKLTTEQRESANAANMMTIEQERLANALNKTSESAKGQSQVLSDLKMMAMQYLSVWGAQSFLNNIIEIGGQLEMQRLSIGAILQDTAHANELFEQIKTQALKSPFGVVELDAMTKQLSAYGFQYNELFEMTNRLANISAATGTSVDRLALALGHVRSEAALSGYTLRQFSMANIPLAKKLSEHLSEVEKRFVSVAEVRQRVRKKEIGYEDVVNVLKELTDEGGMFYNAQEIMSQSVKARFKNLRDAFDIMYGEIAESGIGDALKDVAGDLTVLAKNWKAFIPIIEAGAISFAAYRISLLAVNGAMGENAAATSRAIISYKQKRAEELQSDAIVRKLTADEMQLIQTRNQLTASNIRAAMSTGALTKADTLRLVGLQKISLRESVALMQMGLLTKEEIRAARAGSIMGLQMGKLGNQIKLLGASAASGVASIAKTIINPWTIGFAALSAGMSAWQRYQQRLDDMKTYRETLRTKSDEGTRNLSGELVKYGSIDVSKASADDLRTAISGIIEKLKDYDPSWQLSLKDAFSDEQTGKVRTQAEQFERLRTALNESAEAYKILKLTKDAFNNADDASGGAWYKLQERFSTNINDYNKDFEKYGKAASNLASNIDEVEQALNRAKGADKAFAEAVEGMNIREQIDVLMRNWLDYDNSGTNFGTAKNAFEESLGENGLVGTLNEAVARMDNLNRSWWALQESAIRFKERLYKDLVTNGGYDKNPANWTKGQNDAVLMEYKAFFEQFAKNVPENMRADIMKMMNGLRTDLTGGSPWRIPITFGVGETKQPLVGWRADMQQWLNENNLIFPITPEMSFEDIKKGIHGKIKELQEEADNSGGVLIGLGFKLNALPDEKPDGMAPWGGFNFDRYKQDKTQIKGFTDFLKAFNMPMPKEKKTGGNKEDKEAKRLREIAKLYKDAYDWYNKYEKQVGEAGALKKVQAQFQPLFDEFNKTWKTNLTLDSIPKYKANLESLLTEAMKLYQSPKHKNSYMVEAIKQLRDAISNVGYEEATRKQDEWASKMARQLDDLATKWEIFNSVRESTGDMAFASRVSGINPEKTGTAADVKRMNISDFVGEGIKIDYDRVLNMSEDEIEKYVEGLGLTEDKLKAVINGLKDWQKAKKDIDESDMINYAKFLGTLVDYQSIRQRNQDEYNKTLEETNRLLAENKITKEEADRRISVAGVTLATKNKENEALYSNLYNNSQVMAKNEFQTYYNKELANLNAQHSKGLITLQQYAEKVKALNKIASEFEVTGFLGIRGGVGAFLSGGHAGLRDYYQGKANTALEKGDKKEAAKYQKKANKMSEEENATQQVISSFDQLAKGANMLGDLFNALGNKSLGGALNDAGGLLGGMVSGASSFAALGPWGAAAGAGLGLISGLAGLHDKHREQEIQALKQNVNALEANTDAIKMVRERTFGYDTGQLRKELAKEYTQYEKTFKIFGREFTYNSKYGAAGLAMAEFYQQNSNGSGYKQEYENLKKQRQDYIDMYNAEEDKKDSSGEALIEYKQKIAELDDEIHYFAEDLAKDLWGIDVKSWAQQLSDALATAFENGTNMAKAYKEAVTKILQELANKMLALGIIEPMMERLQAKLFGEKKPDGTYTKGLFDIDDPTGSANKVTNAIAEFFGTNGEGRKTIDAAKEFLSAFEQGVNKAGLSILNKDESSLSSNIKSITEETADIIASYINAIRADVAMNRAFIAMFIQEYWISYVEQITSVHTTLRNIDRNVAAMALTFSEAGKIYGMIENISNRLDKFANGVDKISVQ